MRQYGILVVFDEVMTGFYRTGKMFALNHTNIIPDFLCLSKGITGGFFPLALTIATTKVYEAFLSEDIGKTFLHGHSYTANPIACAAACKSLEILLRNETIERIFEISNFHGESIFHLKNVHKQRIFGTIAAFDVISEAAAKRIAEKLLNEGIFIRPILESVYFLPPYCISNIDLERVYETVNKYL